MKKKWGDTENATLWSEMLKYNLQKHPTIQQKGGNKKISAHKLPYNGALK